MVTSCFAISAIGRPHSLGRLLSGTANGANMCLRMSRGSTAGVCGCFHQIPNTRLPKFSTTKRGSSEGRCGSEGVVRTGEGGCHALCNCFHCRACGAHAGIGGDDTLANAGCGRCARSRQGKARSDVRSQTGRSEEHTSELQSLMRNSYAVFCLKKKNKKR